MHETQTHSLLLSCDRIYKYNIRLWRFMCLLDYKCGININLRLWLWSTHHPVHKVWLLSMGFIWSLINSSKFCTFKHIIFFTLWRKWYRSRLTERDRGLGTRDIKQYTDLYEPSSLTIAAPDRIPVTQSCCCWVTPEVLHCDTWLHKLSSLHKKEKTKTQQQHKCETWPCHLYSCIFNTLTYINENHPTQMPSQGALREAS